MTWSLSHLKCMEKIFVKLSQSLFFKNLFLRYEDSYLMLHLNSIGNSWHSRSQIIPWCFQFKSVSAAGSFRSDIHFKVISQLSFASEEGQKNKKGLNVDLDFLRYLHKCRYAELQTFVNRYKLVLSTFLFFHSSLLSPVSELVFNVWYKSPFQCTFNPL